jgi:predicted Zn-dependent protease
MKKLALSIAAILLLFVAASQARAADGHYQSMLKVVDEHGVGVAGVVTITVYYDGTDYVFNEATTASDGYVYTADTDTGYTGDVTVYVYLYDNRYTEEYRPMPITIGDGGYAKFVGPNDWMVVKAR